MLGCQLHEQQQQFAFYSVLGILSPLQIPRKAIYVDCYSIYVNLIYLHGNGILVWDLGMRPGLKENKG